MGVVLVTGSSGLVGSTCVRHFAARGWRVVGLDNNARLKYFGRDGDTTANADRLKDDLYYHRHFPDVRSREAIDYYAGHYRPDLVIHAAAQPSHDLATAEPVLDFEVNAVGTLNLLEATRRHRPDAAFVFLSTNKVYGDAPNELPLSEHERRYCFASEEDAEGINERMRVDQSRHSLFGASKLAADVLVQEYGRTYGMKTVCFRAGCLTGGAHAGAEQHGFLAYLAKCVREGRPYKVYGYKGKQVRDQLHADDVARACEEFASNPKAAAVYNLGGGYWNSISVLEAIARMQVVAGKRLNWSYVDEPRGGDHICYYTDTRKFQADYPGWKVTRNLESIINELCSPALCEVS